MSTAARGPDRNRRVRRCASRAATTRGNTDANTNEIRSGRRPARFDEAARRGWRIAADFVPDFRMIAAKGVEGGQRHDHRSTRPHDAGHFAKRRHIRLHTLQHVERRRDVERLGGERNLRHIAAEHDPSIGVRARRPARGQVEPDRPAVRLQKTQIVSGATPAIDEPQASPPIGEVANHRCDKFAEASKPEVGRLGATRQFEQIVHRLAAGVQSFIRIE